MMTKQLTTHINESGMLNLNIPLSIKNQDIEVLIVISTKTQREKSHWQDDFVEKFAGCMPDFPENDYEGDFEEREMLL